MQTNTDRSNQQVPEITYKNMAEFYPFYISQHAKLGNRVLHFLGTAMVIGWVFSSIMTKQYPLILLGFLFGYGPAWIGHFFIEKNRPATFKYPFLSLASDFVMFWHILTGKVAEDIKKSQAIYGK